MKQHIFLRDRWIGSREIPTISAFLPGEEPKITDSYALFCPTCANIWARLMHDHPDTYCQCVLSFCDQHMQFSSDGTITAQCPPDGYPRGVFDADDWPREVLLHDIEAVCTFFLNHPEKCYLHP